MELETLFSGTRWEILRLLSHESLSPIELSGLLKTTSANISQQLRLLELAGLVKSERTSAVDKGKPRVIYSLAGDMSYLILAGPSFADKQMMPLTGFHKFILKSWFVRDADFQKAMMRFYIEIEDELGKTSAIQYNEAKKEILIITKKKDDFKKIASLDKAKIKYSCADGADDKFLTLYGGDQK